MTDSFPGREKQSAPEKAAYDPLLLLMALQTYTSCNPGLLEQLRRAYTMPQRSKRRSSKFVATHGDVLITTCRARTVPRTRCVELLRGLSAISLPKLAGTFGTETRRHVLDADYLSAWYSRGAAERRDIPMRIGKATPFRLGTPEP